MNRKTYGFALIGCGAIAKVHARAIQEIPNGTLRGAFSVIPEEAQRFAEAQNCRAYASVEELLADPQVDIVNICVPSGLHAQYFIQAAKAGKHVVVEKPMGITQEQLDQMVSVSEEHNVKSTVIVQLRFVESVQKVKAAIDGGLLGKLYTADCRMPYYRSQEYYQAGGWRGTWKMDGGGALMNQGIHGIDLIQYLMGGIKSVYADCRTLARAIETEDCANLLVEYCCGAMGIIHGSTISNPGEPRTITIRGEKGTITLQEDTIVQWDVEGSPMELAGESSMSSHADPTAIPFAYHFKQMSDLVDAIENDRKPLVDVYEGRKAVDIILAAYRSSQTGTKQYL